MKTINVQMSEAEYSAFGLSKTCFSFGELADIIERRRAMQALHQCAIIAQQCGLSDMTMDDINAQIKAHRQCKR